MKTSPNVMLYPSSEQVMDLFVGRCPKCRKGATTVHELEPRSRGQKSLQMQNRTAICYWCHLEFHNLGASKENIERWKVHIQKYLTSIGKYDEYLNWGKNEG